MMSQGPLHGDKGTGTVEVLKKAVKFVTSFSLFRNLLAHKKGLSPHLFPIYYRFRQPTCSRTSYSLPKLYAS